MCWNWMLKGKYISQQGSAKALSVLIQTSLSASFGGFIHAKCSGQCSLYPGRSLSCVFHVATTLFHECHSSISLASSFLLGAKCSISPGAGSLPCPGYWSRLCPVLSTSHLCLLSLTQTSWKMEWKIETLETAYCFSFELSSIDAVHLKISTYRCWRLNTMWF